MPKTPIFGKKNVLVTGGAGFIGSHLCEALLKTSKVICLDNFSNSTPANIEHLLKDPDFELLKLNVNQPFNLEDFPELEKFKIKFQGVQEIYHLACPTSAKNFIQSKIETLLTNSIGTYHPLEMAVKYKAKFVLGSSAVVYGPRRPDKPAFSEDDLGAVNNLSQRACYDEGKRFAETMTATYVQAHKIDAKIARIFRTYGPRLKLFDSQMISDFIVDAIRGQDLVIYGDKTFSSSLVYVSDVADGLLKLMAAPAGIGAVNFGDERVHLLCDVAKSIIEKVGSKSKIRFERPLEFITPLGIPDIRKAKNELGWMPLVMLEDGLKKTIDYTIAKEKTIGQG
ncbi:MAG: GDP-mannose 4,6-dehydratase [Candidatus Magasanikbacteria bacterium]|nr:GDP-mannose 4,6-dehydratase [Candidatus Magasanikbacteria bacterium]